MRALIAALLLIALAVPNAKAVFVEPFISVIEPADDPEANAAATLFAEGKIKLAREKFEEILAQRPGSVAALLGLADVAYVEGRRGDVKRYLQMALEADADNAAVQTAMGRYFYLSDDIDAALVHFQRAIEIDGKLVDPHAELGSIYVTRRPDATLAKRYYANAVRLAPTNNTYRYAYASVLSSSGALGKATRQLKVAMGFRPNDPYPHELLGTFLVAHGKPEEAIEEFGKAIDINPGLKSALWSRGGVYFRTGKAQQAMRDYKRLVEVDPAFAPAYVQQGLILQVGGEFEQAEPLYKRALSIDPNIALAYNNLAYGAADSAGRTDEALAWAQQAVALQPENPEFQDTLAMVHQRRGELREAEKILVGVVSGYPDFTAASARLDTVREALGKTD